MFKWTSPNSLSVPDQMLSNNDSYTRKVARLELAGHHHNNAPSVDGKRQSLKLVSDRRQVDPQDGRKPTSTCNRQTAKSVPTSPTEWKGGQQKKKKSASSSLPSSPQKFKKATGYQASQQKQSLLSKVKGMFRKSGSKGKSHKRSTSSLPSSPKKYTSFTESPDQGWKGGTWTSVRKVKEISPADPSSKSGPKSRLGRLIETKKQQRKLIRSLNEKRDEDSKHHVISTDYDPYVQREFPYIPTATERVHDSKVDRFLQPDDCEYNQRIWGIDKSSRHNANVKQKKLITFSSIQTRPETSPGSEVPDATVPQMTRDSLRHSLSFRSNIDNSLGFPLFKRERKRWSLRSEGSVGLYEDHVRTELLPSPNVEESMHDNTDKYKFGQLRARHSLSDTDRESNLTASLTSVHEYEQSLLSHERAGLGRVKVMPSDVNQILLTKMGLTSPKERELKRELSKVNELSSERSKIERQALSTTGEHLLMCGNISVAERKEQLRNTPNNILFAQENSETNLHMRNNNNGHHGKKQPALANHPFVNANGILNKEPELLIATHHDRKIKEWQAHIYQRPQGFSLDITPCQKETLNFEKCPVQINTDLTDRRQCEVKSRNLISSLVHARTPQSFLYPNSPSSNSEDSFGGKETPKHSTPADSNMRNSEFLSISHWLEHSKCSSIEGASIPLEEEEHFQNHTNTDTSWESTGFCPRDAEAEDEEQRPNFDPKVMKAIYKDQQGPDKRSSDENEVKEPVETIRSHIEVHRAGTISVNDISRDFQTTVSPETVEEVEGIQSPETYSHENVPAAPSPLKEMSWSAPSINIEENLSSTSDLYAKEIISDTNTSVFGPHKVTRQSLLQCNIEASNSAADLPKCLNVFQGRTNDVNHMSCMDADTRHMKTGQPFEQDGFKAEAFDDSSVALVDMVYCSPNVVHSSGETNGPATVLTFLPENEVAQKSVGYTKNCKDPSKQDLSGVTPGSKISEKGESVSESSAHLGRQDSVSLSPSQHKQELRQTDLLNPTSNLGLPFDQTDTTRVTSEEGIMDVEAPSDMIESEWSLADNSVSDRDIKFTLYDIEDVLSPPRTQDRPRETTTTTATSLPTGDDRNETCSYEPSSRLTGKSALERRHLAASSKSEHLGEMSSPDVSSRPVEVEFSDSKLRRDDPTRLIETHRVGGLQAGSRTVHGPEVSEKHAVTERGVRPLEMFIMPSSVLEQRGGERQGQTDEEWLKSRPKKRVSFKLDVVAESSTDVSVSSDDHAVIESDSHCHAKVETAVDNAQAQQRIDVTSFPEGGDNSSTDVSTSITDNSLYTKEISQVVITASIDDVTWCVSRSSADFPGEQQDRMVSMGEEVRINERREEVEVPKDASVDSNIRHVDSERSRLNEEITTKARNVLVHDTAEFRSHPITESETISDHQTNDEQGEEECHVMLTGSQRSPQETASIGTHGTLFLGNSLKEHDNENSPGLRESPGNHDIDNRERSQVGKSAAVTEPLDSDLSELNTPNGSVMGRSEGTSPEKTSDVIKALHENVCAWWDKPLSTWNLESSESDGDRLTTDHSIGSRPLGNVCGHDKMPREMSGNEHTSMAHSQHQLVSKPSIGAGSMQGTQETATTQAQQELPIQEDQKSHLQRQQNLDDGRKDHIHEKRNEFHKSNKHFQQKQNSFISHPHSPAGQAPLNSGKPQDWTSPRTQANFGEKQNLLDKRSTNVSLNKDFSSQFDGKLYRDGPIILSQFLGKAEQKSIFGDSPETIDSSLLPVCQKMPAQRNGSESLNYSEKGKCTSKPDTSTSDDRCHTFDCKDASPVLCGVASTVDLKEQQMMTFDTSDYDEKRSFPNHKSTISNVKSKSRNRKQWKSNRRCSSSGKRTLSERTKQRISHVIGGSTSDAGSGDCVDSSDDILYQSTMDFFPTSDKGTSLPHPEVRCVGTQCMPVQGEGGQPVWELRTETTTKRPSGKRKRITTIGSIVKDRNEALKGSSRASRKSSSFHEDRHGDFTSRLLQGLSVPTLPPANRQVMESHEQQNYDCNKGCSAPSYKLHRDQGSGGFRFQQRGHQEEYELLSGIYNGSSGGNGGLNGDGCGISFGCCKGGGCCGSAGCAMDSRDGALTDGAKYPNHTSRNDRGSMDNKENVCSGSCPQESPLQNRNVPEGELLAVRDLAKQDSKTGTSQGISRALACRPGQWLFLATFFLFQFIMQWIFSS
ncbi:uncharacterized protein LOC101856590 [Aplysia californica]|uniref:Uncharacterized protein LOC101856590 n=1 Tax=Aplysia californica TaxID=6500 RepID=A0ABM0JWR5_APLCA|nr:uncharacterized protein LOC101856590 [Aplysia californica]XP_005103358.1 uncharacterized protein LOC101856590 [Aplysia californica]XP_035826945.1 uncharacterized protein LOC101856590 [Aplysia californica]